MNKIQVLSAIFILASASGQVMADDYQLETGVSSWNYNAQGYHASELQLDLKYFFSPVSIEDRPLAVAYFLGRNSNLYGYGFSNIVNHSSNGAGVRAETWKNDFYSSASYDRVYGTDTYNVNLGYMLNDNCLVTLGATDGDSYTSTSYSGSAKYVGRLTDKYVNAEASAARTNDVNYYTLGGDYFYTNAFSLGGAVTHRDATTFETKYVFRTQYFLTSRTSVSARFERNLGQDTTYVALSTRF